MLAKPLVAFSASQLVALDSLRVNFKDRTSDVNFKLDNLLYIRYLRARNFEAIKATTMLEKTIQWRSSFNIDSMKTWRRILDNENSTGKLYVRGFSEEGNALIYAKPKFENSTSHDGKMKHFVFTMEKAVKSMDHQGRGAEKLIIIIDLNGYSILNAPPMQTAIETINVFQNHYPERLHRAYVINPPYIFMVLYNLISPLLDANTKSKVRMLSDPDAIKKELLSQVDAEVLEAGYGGCDVRQFDSALYMAAPLEQDFASVVNSGGTVSSGKQKHSIV